jgi:pyruvate dehydrogenase E2 component (dihydrolipoamide acetyltransferase)
MPGSDVIVPEVGELGMDVTFVRWLKDPGDEVAVGDPLFEVDTEKSVMVVEAYAAGRLTDVRVSEGDSVAPRDVIGRIVSDEDVMGDASRPSADMHVTEPESVPGAQASSSAAPGTDSRPPSPGVAAGHHPGRASPRARRLAAELGVDIAALVGTGPDGLITEADVRSAEGRASAPEAGAASTAKGAATDDPAARARRAIAELTTASWRSIPHFYLQLEADVDAGLDLAKPTPLVCSAVARALARHPECNLAWEGDAPARRDRVDIGLLVDAPSGLLITVLDDADKLDLAGMADAIAAAVGRARRGTLAAADFGPRSISISNLGMYAVDRFSAVIARPDVLTLAVGRSRAAPRWDDSTFVPRRVMDLTLSVDHRALDGAAAARFMTTLASVLADPAASGLA